MQRSTIFIIFAFISGYALSLIVHQSSVGQKATSMVSEILPDKKWNWCPMEVSKLLISKTSQVIIDPSEVSELCRASMTRVLPANSTGHFQAILRAQNNQGQVTFLEYDPSQKLFRTESNVFSSENFEKSVGKVLTLPK
jgi:hypothetical protein